MNVDIKDLQKKQLEILKKLKKICTDKNIDYYLAYGTCLGAIRHNGFIPWDDDIDIIMKYSDLLTLLNNKDLLPSELFLQTKETDPEYGLPIARLRINDTTLIEEDQASNDIHHGVYIDIYPLYNCPKSSVGFFFLRLQALIFRLFLYGQGAIKKGRLVGTISSFLVKITPKYLKKYYINKFQRKVSKIPESSHYITLYGNDFSIRYCKDFFSKPVDVLFEGELYPTPTDSHSYLKLMYGDYMKLPPKDQRKHHHDFLFIDLESDYKKYKGVKYLKEFSNES